jgi:hypothetical protein
VKVIVIGALAVNMDLPAVTEAGAEHPEMPRHESAVQIT